MNSQQLKLIAHQYHMKRDRQSKQKFIQSIKHSEGTFTCFQLTAEKFDKEYKSLRPKETTLKR